MGFTDSVLTSALTILHYASPIVLLFFFLFVVTLRSIVVTNNAAVPQSGTSSPVEYALGGKPLPPRKQTQEKSLRGTLDFSKSRKLAFIWLSAFTACTFLGNAAVVIIHVLADRSNSWWCGQAYTVRASLLLTWKLLTDHHAGLRYRMFLRLRLVPHFPAGYSAFADIGASLNMDTRIRFGGRSFDCVDHDLCKASS